MSLSGVLSDFGVADVFQLIAQQRKTGVLEIDNDERQLEVHFLDGQVVRARPSESRADGALASFLLRAGGLREPDLAEALRLQEETLETLPEIVLREGYVPKADLEAIARLLSEETIFELFLWDEGRFAFRPGAVNPQVGDLMVGAEMVLLDALRMRDEWAQVRSVLPDLGVVAAPTVEIEVYRERRAAIESASGLLGENLDRLFMRCNGRLTARRVIDLSRLGTFQGARGLIGMLHEGVLCIAHKASKPERAKRTVLRADAWGRGAWVLILAGLVAAALFAIPGPVARTYPVPDEALSHAHKNVDLERLRAALEAHRWQTGKYPESLEVLAGTEGSFSTPLPLHRYIYARSSGGYTLVER